MIVDGQLDVQIRTLNSAGVPTSATSLVGIVRNSLGEQVHRFDFNNLTETAHGVYEHEDYDVSDPSLFPGATMSIFWYTCDEGVSPETTFQYYDFLPNAPVRSRNGLITWMPVPGDLFGYAVYRQKPSEDEMTVLGYATSPYFIDTSTYTSDHEFYGSKWNVTALSWGGADDPTPQTYLDATDLSLYRTEHDFCVISGVITDVIGRPTTTRSIYFYVHESDAPMMKGSTLFMRRNEVVAPVNSDGYFSIPLIQGLYITCEIPDTGVAGKFLVPVQKHAQFTSLDITPIERYRGQ